MSLLTRNYFRVGEELHPDRSRGKARYYFFDDESLPATESAYGLALQDAGSTHGRICIFRPPRHEGTWDDIQVIGHRSLRVLNADFQSLETILERDALTNLVLWRRSLPSVDP